MATNRPVSRRPSRQSAKPMPLDERITQLEHELPPLRAELEALLKVLRERAGGAS